MATQVQNRRGTTAEHSTFTGAVGEVTIDTDKDTVVVHDGSTAGGRPLLREDQSNLPTSAPTTGIYNNSGALALSTNGTGRLFVDDSGRLLVGTSSASGNGLIQVRSDLAGVCYEAFRAVGSSATSAPVFRFNKSRGTAASPTEVNSGDVLGYLAFAGYDGAAFADAAYITAIADGTWTDGGDTTDNPGALVFSTTADGASSPTEQMRITSRGDVVIGLNRGTLDSSNFGTRIGTNGLNGLDYGVIVSYRQANGGSIVAQLGGTVGYARVMGDGDLENTNNRYTGISDIKLKQNIEDASSQWQDIKSIQVRKYELIEHPERKHIGVVAQELEQVCPGLVIERILDEETGETVKSVAYSVLYMKAVKALQEAMERIETLEAKVTALEGA